MPNVPHVPGVPPLSSYAANAITLLVADAAVSAIAAFLRPSWGVFKNGVPIIVAESVVSVDYRQEWLLSTYPVEEGAFESYDKVQTPFENRVRFMSGGPEGARQILLNSIDAIAGDLNLYDVVTPTKTYTSVNVMRYDYARAAGRGLGLLVVDIVLQQVRVAVPAAFSNTQAPSGASPTSGGQVQPSSATSGQIGKLSAVQ